MKCSLQKSFSAVALLAAMFFLAACSSSGDGFPRIANPPNFDFADGEELRSGMHQLAYELQRLDIVLMADSDNRPDYQQSVISSLQNIERIAGSIREGDISARHPFLRSDMDKFLADVTRAREDATRGSSRYYMAGRVSGACVTCHRANDI